MKRNGFTLIEILVVIAIIASIIAIAIPNFLSARQRAQDVKTKSEMSALKDALRLYYNDFNSYPPSTGKPDGLGMLKGCGTNGDAGCPCTSGGLDFATGAAACDNVYMKQLPAGLGSTILYKSSPSGTDDFCMSVLLNNASDPDITISQNRCRGACGTTYPIPPIPNTKYWACAD